MRFRVASHTPGRIRLRGPRSKEDTRYKEIAAALGDKDCISDVQTNYRTGSLLISYSHLSRDDLLRILHDVGLILAETESGGPLNGGNGSGLVRAITDLDDRVRAILGSNIDLRKVVPLSLAAIGLWRAFLSRGLGLSQVPPFFLLWYAFDLYYKFNVDPDDLFPNGPD